MSSGTTTIPVCGICLSDTNKSTRSPVTCAHCATTTCRACIQHYLLQDVSAEPHCPDCRGAWDPEFCAANLTATFRNGPYKAHRKAIMLERERAQLPTAMPDALAYRAAKAFVDEHDSQSKAFLAAIYDCESYSAFKAAKDALDTEMRACVDFKERVNYINSPTYSEHKLRIDAARNVWNTETESARAEFAAFNTMLHEPRAIVHNFGRAAHAQQQQAQQYTYIHKCANTACTGFLKDWTCELCETQVCAECREIKIAGHVCDPTAVESVAAITAQAKPCPSCATMISKVDGCDQMWCIQCKTAFSWTTGALETTVIHNPHYYEWVRRNGLPLPRNREDCAALILDSVEQTIAPHLSDATDHDRRVAAAHIFRSLRNLRHLEIIKLREFQQILTTHADPEWRRVLRVKYLVDGLSETKWAETLIRAENTNARARAQHALLSMYLQTSKDILGQVVGSSDGTVYTNVYNQYETLKNYVLEEDKRLARIYNTTASITL
jgi:hypothetical protein